MSPHTYGATALGYDPYNLARFVAAQTYDYDRALMEVCRGRKQSHWMWYIFPQFEGLGFSANSVRYAIKSRDEAKAYLDHPVLGVRLLECANAVVRLRELTAVEIFGSPDDLKLRSSATLFATVSPAKSVFEEILEYFFDGAPDPLTLRLMRLHPDGR